MNSNHLKNIVITLPKATEEQINSAQYYIEHCLKTDELSTVAENLINWPHLKLILLCQKSHLVENFCLTNELFTKKIVAKLKAANYPTQTVVCNTSNDTYTVFDLYLSASYMSTYLNLGKSANVLERKTVLQQACRLGSIRALVELCRFNYKIIKDDEQDNDSKEIAIRETWETCLKLSNLYWAAGYVYAGGSLLKLGSYLKNIEPARGKTIIEQAVKNFLCAYLLRNHEYSNQIIADIVGDEGVYSIVTINNTRFSNWYDAINACKILTKDSYGVIEKQASSEIKELLQIQEQIIQLDESVQRISQLSI